MANQLDFSQYYVCLANGEDKLLEYLVDLRETLPKDKSFHIEVTGLHTGDVLVGRVEQDYENPMVTENFGPKKIPNLRPLILIERKGIVDFCRSFRSNHYQNQKTRMMKFRAATNTRCALVVEGYYDAREMATRIEGIPISTLEQCFTSIRLRDEFLVKHVENQYFHADFILKCLKSIEKYQLYAGTYGDRDATLQRDYEESLRVQKKKNFTPEICYKIQLSAIPGVSLSLAETIADKYPNFKVLIRAFEEEGPTALAEIKQGKNRIGKKSETIYSYVMPRKALEISKKK